MSGDMTAAERMRRYRARARAGVTATVTNTVTERNGETVTHRNAEVAELVTAVTALTARVTALVTLLEHKPAPTVTERNGENVTASRNVTVRYGAANDSRARIPAAHGPLQGPSEPRSSETLRTVTAVTPATMPTSRQLDRIAEILRRSPGPASVASIALELEAPADKVRRVLDVLVEVGRARRTLNDDGFDRWEIADAAAAEVGETIECADYHGHQLTAHRRDPATGRFRCYACNPEPATAGVPRRDTE